MNVKQTAFPVDTLLVMQLEDGTHRTIRWHRAVETTLIVGEIRAQMNSRLHTVERATVFEGRLAPQVYTGEGLASLVRAP